MWVRLLLALADASVRHGNTDAMRTMAMMLQAVPVPRHPSRAARTLVGGSGAVPRALARYAVSAAAERDVSGTRTSLLALLTLTRDQRTAEGLVAAWTVVSQALDEGTVRWLLSPAACPTDGALSLILASLDEAHTAAAGPIFLVPAVAEAVTARGGADHLAVPASFLARQSVVRGDRYPDATPDQVSTWARVIRTSLEDPSLLPLVDFAAAREVYVESQSDLVDWLVPFARSDPEALGMLSALAVDRSAVVRDDCCLVRQEQVRWLLDELAANSLAALKVLARVGLLAPDVILHAGGIPAILAATASDAAVPLRREWALLTLRHLSVSSPAVREYLSDLRPEKLTDESAQALRDMGMSGEVTGDGKVRVVRKEKR